jgi:uncharacterized phage protein (TIGR01671 family)
MREIKFRAWDKEDNQMYYSTDVLDEIIWEFINGGIKVVKKTLGKEECVWVEEDFPIMQFNGLLDKFGKEIYEGDIVNIYFFGKDVNGKLNPEPNIIIKDLETFYRWKRFDDLRYFEIIGNIYENPELLK